jgi:hypothetical protein
MLFDWVEKRDGKWRYRGRKDVVAGEDELNEEVWT